MNVLGVLCFAAAVLTVSARHKREWEYLNMKKATREILMPLYRSETPICHKGPGFYRDPNDCHQYIRCVDDFSSGRRLTLFVGRCRPGLVFDENISSCNWPELTAPCRNSPERYQSPASKLNPKESNIQDNGISDHSGINTNWNKYQSQQQKPNKQDPKLQEPVDGIKNVFQEAEAQEKIGQSFEDSQDPQVQITEQETEPQVAEGFEEIPVNNEQHQIPITEQVREPVIQEKDEQVREPVVQEKDERVREPVIQEKDEQVREPVVQEKDETISQKQVIQQQYEPIPQNPDIRDPVVAQQTQQIKEHQQVRKPAIQEQTLKVQETPKTRQPVIQEQTQQVKENPKTRQPVIQEKNEHVSKHKQKVPTNQKQNNEEVPVWDEDDAQEKIYQPNEDHENAQNPLSQDTQRTNGQQQQQNIYDNNLASQFQEQMPSGFFQEIPDNENSRSQWFVPEGQSSESTAIIGIAAQNDKHRGQAAPTTLEEALLCSKAGYFRHPKNCSRFFRCVENEQGSFSIHFFQCASHLTFDEKISHCSDSESVKCASRRPKRQADETPLECSGEGFFRHPNDCRSFYRCVKLESGDYETHMFSCPANLVFDEEYATCNWPDKAPPCDTRRQFWKPTRASASTPSRPSFKPYQRTTAKGYKSTSKPRNDFIEPLNPFTTGRDSSRTRNTQKPRYTTQSSSNYGQLCNSPGFYRHDQDCTKFYKCVQKGNYFVRYELSCPNNYAYDEISSRCVSKKYASSCNGRNNRPPFRQNDDEPSTTTESDVRGDDNESSPEEDGIECTEAGYFRNPNDCNKFYRCVDFSGEGQEFVRYDFSCPEGLVFDEKKSICNWPDPTAPCEGGSGKGGNGEDESNISDGKGESEESSSSTTPRSTSESGRRSTTETTPKRDRSTSRPKENTPKPGKSTSRPKENTPKPGRTTSRPKESTTKPKESTSKPRENTPKPEGESSKEPNESENGCSEEGFFRNSEDCNKFYRCVDSSGNGKEFLRYDFDCPEGLVFDEANSVCNWPDASAPCEGGSSGGGNGKDESNIPDNENESEEESSTTPSSNDESGRRSTTTTRKQTDKSTPKPGKSTSKPREGTSKPSRSTSRPKEGTPKPGRSTSRPRENTPKPDKTTSEPEESTTRQDESSKEQGESESDNGCDGEGFFRNKEDCNKFYRCVDFNGDGQEFVRYDFDCPEGLVFDEANSVCNWPSEVEECGSGSGVGSNKNKKESSTSSSQESEDSTTTKPTTQKGRGSTTKKPSTQKGRESTTSKPSTQKGRESTTTKPSTQKGRGSTTSRPRTTAVEDSETDKENPSVTESSSTDQESSTSSGGKRGGSSNGECNEEGFFRNPDDCNKFYRCVDNNGDGKEFVKYDFSCPGGLVFDEENSVCNWPDQAAPCEGSAGKKGSGKEGSGKEGSGKEGSGEEGTGKDGNESSTPSTTSNGDETSTTSTTRKRGETSTASTTTRRDDSSTTRRTTKSPSSKSTRRPQTTKSPSDKTTRRPQSTKSTTPQSSTSSDQTTEGSTATNRDETTKDETSESTKQKSDGECTEEGFFRNPDDCGKFYRCVDFNGDGQQFVKYDFDCPDGLHFDEVNSVCNWPEQSPPCETGSGTTSGGKSKTTESGSTTDSTAQETQSTTQTTQSDESTTTAKTASTTQSTTTSSEPSSTTKDTSTSSGKESDCTEEGFFRCKDDCNKFYRCVDDGQQLVRYDFKCPEGLIFDDKNKKCDFPSEELSCDSESTSTTPSSTRSTTQSATQTTGSESTSGTTTTSSKGSTKSSKECTEEGYFRDPDDCSKYYRCLDEGDGTLTREEFSCAEDEVFDEEMRYCNRKDLAPACEEGTTSTDSQSTTSSGSSTTASGTSETTSISSTTPGESTTEKSSQTGCRKEGFFRCEEDCNRFYRCVDEDGNGNFKRYNFSCPEGLIFDEQNERCDWPSEELTCDTETTGSSTTSGGSTTSRGGSTSSGTTSSTTTSGSTSTSSSGECTEEGYFRNPDDCSKYYRCLDEGDGTLTREDFSCAEDEVFDDEMNYCNRKDLAPPCDESSSTTGSSRSTTQSGSTTTGSESSTTEAISSTTTAQTTSSGTESNESTTNDESGSTKGITEGSTQSSTKSGECEEEGFHRHPNDCTKFYRCVDFAGDGQSYTKYEFECPEGLVFDEETDVCNWPSSVPSCESSEKKSTTSSDTEADGSITSTTPGDRSTSTTDSDSTSTTTTKKDSSSTGTTAGTTSEDTEGTYSSTTSSGTTSSTGSTSSDKKSEDIECTEEGFFRNPDDCTKFYRCVDFAGTGESFTRYDFECPDDLVFDDVNKVCNWPNMSPGCESRSEKEKNDSKSTTTAEEDSRSTTESTTNTDESQSTGTTAGESTGTTSGDSTPSTSGTRATSTTSGTESDEFVCEDEGFFKHPKDCKKYYECKRDEDTGELVQINCECPAGHVFDEEAWYCNAEELSPPCDDGSFQCKEEGFFRDPEDCTKYYRCNQTGSGFRKESFQCSDGNVFDEEGRYCNAPELTEPCNSTSSTSSSSGTTSMDQSTTPGSGTSSNPTSTTGSETSSTGSSKSSGQQDCTEEGFFRNPEDCTKYYQCTRNEDSGEFERKDFDCPDGRIFDEGVSYCNDPELSDEPCESSSTSSSTQGQTDSTTSTGTSTTEQTGGTDSSITTTTESSTTKSGKGPGTRRGGGDPECTQAGFFRHPKDCNKFYRCVDFAGTGESFVRFDFDCPEGLHFDEVNSTCNWPTMSPRCESESE